MVVQRLFSEASLRELEQDTEFLRDPETRGIRLQLEYAKAESILRRHNVAHTIVVFGSTRIEDPQLIGPWSANPGCGLPPNGSVSSGAGVRTVASQLADKGRYYDIARELGRIVGRACESMHGGQTMIMTGGGPGIMEAANRGAADVGAKSIGLNIALPKEQAPNRYVTPELCISFRYFALRKFHFALRARALVVFPGGFGTLDELFEILELSQTKKMPPVPVVLVGKTYWRRVIDPDFLVSEGMIDPEDRDLFWYAESARDVWDGILRWHERRGQPLFCGCGAPI